MTALSRRTLAGAAVVLLPASAVAATTHPDAVLAHHCADYVRRRRLLDELYALAEPRLAWETTYAAEVERLHDGLGGLLDISSSAPRPGHCWGCAPRP